MKLLFLEVFLFSDGQQTISPSIFSSCLEYLTVLLTYFVWGIKTSVTLVNLKPAAQANASFFPWIPGFYYPLSFMNNAPETSTV